MSCIIKYKNKEFTEAEFDTYMANNQQEFISYITKLSQEKAVEGELNAVKNKQELIGISDISNIGKLEGQFLDNPTITSERGQLGFNTEQMLKLLGRTMYDSPVDQVAMKEMLQNSFDACKAMQNIKGDGRIGNIHITLDKSNRSITIKDDGIGMSPDIVKNAFLMVGGTDKTGLTEGERSGGFGLAKVQFLLSSEQIKLITIKDGIKTTVEATPIQLYTNDFNILTEKTDLPNGTELTTKIPTQYETEGGEKKQVQFHGNYIWNIDDLTKKYDILTYPLIGNIKVTGTITGLRGNDVSGVLPIGINNSKELLPSFFTTVKFTWGEADIYMSEEKSKSTFSNHIILSSGLFQFKHRFYTDNFDTIPYDIVINIKPSIEASGEQYPFNNQREGFKKTVNSDIKALEKFIATWARGESEKELIDVFKDIKGLPKTNVTAILSTEERKRFDEDFKNTLDESKKISKELNKQEDGRGKWQITRVLIENGSINLENKETTDKKTEKNYDVSAKFDKEIEKNSPLNVLNLNQETPQYHNNTTMDYLQTEGAAEFFSDFGTVVLDLVRFAGNELGYDYKKLKGVDEKFFAGVSIDKTYGGVHTRQFLNAIFVNPFSFSAKNIEGLTQLAMHLTLHEINHTTVSGEGAAFTSQFAALLGKIGDTGKYSYFEGLFRAVYTKHLSTYKILKHEYDKSSTRNISKSFNGENIAPKSDGESKNNGETLQNGQFGHETLEGSDENSTKSGDVIASNLKDIFKISSQKDNSKNNQLNKESSLSTRGVFDKTAVIEHDDGKVTFLMYNLSGKIVGRQTYNPEGVKSPKSKDEPLRYVLKGREGENQIFGLHTYNAESPYLFVVEGVFDALMLHQMGFPAIAILTATPSADMINQVKLLNGKKIGILDNDKTNTGLKLKKITDDSFVVPFEKDLNDLYLNNKEEFKKFADTLTTKYEAAHGLYTPLKTDSLSSEQTQAIKEVWDNNEELRNAAYEALGVTYTDEDGNLCAADGFRTNFTKGGKWEIIKDFKGASHARGGIDIEIGGGKIKMSGKQGEFKAKFGLVLSKNNYK